MIARLALKGVRGHVLRFLLTAFAVTLGVALVAGTFVLSDSIRSTFDELFDSASQGLDVQVRGVAGGEGVQGDTLRKPLPVDLATTLRGVPGVQRAVADYQGSALLVGKDGTAVRSGGAPTFGFAWADDDPSLHLVAGRAPRGPSEVAVESSTLKKSGLKVGDRTQALVGREPRPVTVTGEVKFDAGLAGATIVIVDEATARQEFAPDGTVSSLSLRAQPGVSPATLRQRVAAVLPADAEAVTGATVAKENRDQIGQALGFITTFLLAFAVVSLVVGMFIIYNTFTMLVAQRTRELALLRAVGSSRRQVVRMVVGEAAVVGLVGALAGIGVGLGLAAGLQALFGTFGLEISGSLPLHVRTVVWSLVIGIGVTVTSALFPAVRASRIAPVAAMRDDIAPPVKGLRVRGGVGLALLAVGAAALGLAVEADDVVWPLAGLGAGLVVLGAIVAAPLATRPFVRVIATPFLLLSRTVTRLARENSLRNPRRTASTATALMIGLSLVVGLSVVAQSTKASVSDLVDRQLTADFVLNGGQTQIPTSVAERVAELPGVQSVATIGGVQVDVDGKSSFAVAAGAKGIADNVVVDMRSGALDALDRGQVLVSEGTAKDRGWRTGSTVTATVGALQDVPLTVGGVFADNQVLSGDLVVPRELYTRAVPVAQQGDFAVYVRTAPGADRPAVRAELTSTVKPFLVVSVQDGKEFTDAQSGQVNQILYVLYALVALALVIAVLGIVNTLALSVFERTREIGLLRAVGLRRRQLTAMVTIESVSIAVFGALLGSLVGLGLGVALQRGLAGDGLEVLAVPWGTIAAIVAFTALAGVGAAVLPAWRAVRLDVLRAVTTE